MKPKCAIFCRLLVALYMDYIFPDLTSSYHFYDKEGGMMVTKCPSLHVEPRLSLQVITITIKYDQLHQNYSLLVTTVMMGKIP